MSTERVYFPTADDSGAGDFGGAPGRSTGSTASDPASTSATDPSTGAPRATKLLDRVVDGAHQTIDRLAERAAPRVAQLEQTVHGAGDTLQQRAGQARDVGDEWLESMRTSVREHPVAAVGIALAVGVLIARMTER